ncbi:MAG: FAD:protein FMN transferase [Anaerolineales bacterium]|nr:FAD:protein FMN transferase [Anaerolineales bacterium]
MNKDFRLRQFNRNFRAMGTEVALWLWNNHEQRAETALAAAARFFAETEATLSRFRPESELMRLNRAAGRPFTASPVLYNLVESALEWRRRTEGIFDPTVLNALIAAGYDRPFDAIHAANGDALPAVTSPAVTSHVAPASEWSVDLNAINLLPNRQILLAAGVGLDLGGIAKGWTIQQAANRLGMWGPCLVNAGGDVACTGSPPGEPWVVTMPDPRADDLDLAVLALQNETVATSSRTIRRWQHNGKPAHHLIDPRTGAPAETAVLSVTVVSPRLPDGEIHAKTALILGAEAGIAYLERVTGIAAMVVTDDGRQLTCGRFEEKGYGSTRSFAERFGIGA